MLTIMAQCWLCQQPLYHSHHGICSHCRRHLPLPVTCCPRCGLPSASDTLSCGRCLQQPPPWQSLLFVSDYRPPLSTLLKRIKFQGRTELAPALARLMLLQWLARRRDTALSLPAAYPRPDAIVTVPLHRRRHWRRGFNQTELLARLLARWLGCAYHPTALVRVRPTVPQQTLGARSRRRNLRGAFECRHDVVNKQVVGKRLVLLDDVVTTGSTAAEVSRVLRQAGAQQVQVWCLCRTLS
ncbi:DNA utilization protein GntX [Dickeya dianthicola]|uniref:DNA utilization protein GntX n=1 Tax=Dickeya dianthicola TaxID=204039 RepID=A0AAX1CBX5_9GAMM|nr:DNA utilization protein GntX [Dickeya dianthicola]MCI4003791.1 DNA utilization protein GntX [Dickeya dianthicola]MCI4031538.1 DNA utilization protein GntX [Dickeya dianthicola]MCI4174996.1 DNA utilization protein GntX [Dickeya dianthicola]MCI4177932.1 DNA utilization protein GntX [Dickeya dianthicola]MCI4180635.1 DNA utilization protein GntX [Dickeya dianthicola]